MALTTTILGWLAAVVPGLLFMLGTSGEGDVVGGSGLAMAAGSSIVVALAANALRPTRERTRNDSLPSIPNDHART